MSGLPEGASPYEKLLYGLGGAEALAALTGLKYSTTATRSASGEGYETSDIVTLNLSTDTVSEDFVNDRFALPQSTGR